MTASNFIVPTHARYFEHYLEGSVHEFDSFIITERDIIEFGKKFDPQPVHIDARAAIEGPFGGLIASGWHTAAVMMRSLVDNFFSSVAMLGSAGVDELRWHKPVRPLDSLRVRVTVVDTRPSRTKPDRGVVRYFVEALNAHGESVASFKGMCFIKLEPR